MADPDHSRSIDLDEFRVFLADLQSLETEPERFQLELAGRLERCARTESSRSLKNDEFGLFSETFSSSLAQLNLLRGGGRFRVRPMSMSCVDDLPRKTSRESSAIFSGEAADAELGNVDGSSVGAEVRKGRGNARRHTDLPSLRTAVMSYGVGVEPFETKTEDV